MKDSNSKKAHMMRVIGAIVCFLGMLFLLYAMADGFNADRTVRPFLAIFFGLSCIINSYDNHEEEGIGTFAPLKTNISDEEDIDNQTQAILDAYEKSARKYDSDEEYEEAINEWHKYIDIAKFRGYKSKEAYGYNELAYIYEENKECEKAIESYTKVMDLGEANEFTYNSRAKLYKECGKFKEALEDHIKCLEFEDSGYVHMLIGDTYTKMGEFEKALDEYIIAMRYDMKFGNEIISTEGGNMLYFIHKTVNQCCPTSLPIALQIYCKIGITCYFLEDYDEAIKIFKIALEKRPDNEDARLYLKKALKAKGVTISEDGENRE